MNITKTKTNIPRRLDFLRRKNKGILTSALQNWLNRANKKILSDIRSRITKQVEGEMVDWAWIEAEGIRILKPAMLKVYVSGKNVPSRVLGIGAEFDVFNEASLRRINDVCGTRIKQIAEETRVAVVRQIEVGVREGLSDAKIANRLKPLVGLTTNQTESVVNYQAWLEERHPELTATKVDKEVRLYAQQTQNRRVETISRTEVATIQNVGYCDGLKDAGINQVELSPSPNCCEICQGMKGNKYSVEEGAGVVPVHPNCRCCMLPVTGV